MKSLAHAPDSKPNRGCAVITGAASGLGRLLSLSLCEQGYHVVAWDIDEPALAALAQEANEKKLTLSPMLCNIADPDQVYLRAADVLALGVPVELLVNNAGVVSGKGLIDTPDTRIIKTFEVNTFALFWTTKAFLPSMMERNQGLIINIASAAGIIGTAGLVDYTASKFAAFGFDEALRMELKTRKSKVRTLVVCPFFIDTGMFAGVQTKVPLLLPILKPEYVIKRILRAIRFKRSRLILPGFVKSVWWLRLFGVGFFDWMANLLGVNHSMDRFTGRQPRP